MNRGVLYIVWGTEIEAQLNRSIQSVKKYYPNLSIHVERVQNLAERALLQKARMGSITPFESTLYLDADTVVLGNLDHAFSRSEQFGLGCSICECPWARRYGAEEGDNIEYNTGVLFFTRQARSVFDSWESLAPIVPALSRWTAGSDGKIFGSNCDDQASFSRAVQSSGLNPFILPFNYNFRPTQQRSFFTPLKIWHSTADVPDTVAEMSAAAESGKSLTSYVFLEWHPSKE
jgi:hypothetical protein